MAISNTNNGYCQACLAARMAPPVPAQPTPPRPLTFKDVKWQVAFVSLLLVAAVVLAILFPAKPKANFTGDLKPPPPNPTARHYYQINRPTENAQGPTTKIRYDGPDRYANFLVKFTYFDGATPIARCERSISVWKGTTIPITGQWIYLNNHQPGAEAYSVISSISLNGDIDLDTSPQDLKDWIKPPRPRFP